MVAPSKYGQLATADAGAVGWVDAPVDGDEVVGAPADEVQAATAIVPATNAADTTFPAIPATARMRAEVPLEMERKESAVNLRHMRPHVGIHRRGTPIAASASRKPLQGLGDRLGVQSVPDGDEYEKIPVVVPERID